MKYLGFLFLFTLWAFSCGTEKNHRINSEIEKKAVFFEKLDSVRIEYLGNLRVHDLNPASKTVLFEDEGPYSQQIILADFDGTIINSFSKFGDMPDTYGSLLSSMRLLGGNSILVYGSNGFLTFDYEGSMLSRVRLVGFEPANYSPIFTGHGMEKLRDRYLYVNQSFPPNKDYSDKSIYNDIYLLNWLDPKTGKKEPFVQFPESSIFRNGKYFFRNAWDPVYNLADARIYVAFGLEPVIYVFDDSPPYPLLSSFPLDLQEYRYFKGADEFSSHWTFFGLRFTSGMILNIKKFEGYFLVAYFPGYDNADTDMRFSNKSPEETVAFNDRMKQKYPNRIAVLDSAGGLINDFVPEGLEAYSMLVRNGELWMLETPDEEVEQDYFRLFRVGLKFD